jgi:hypothetical protein
MDRGWFARLRWRRRGAWLWPAFAAMTVVDAVIGHLLPVSGDSESLPAAGLAGLVASLIAVVLLSRPLGGLRRRIRPNLPAGVARNQAGTSVVFAVTAVFLAAGLAHHQTVVGDQRAMQDAIARAQAWIGARASDTFVRDLRFVNTFAIQPGSIYRICVPSMNGRQDYCVVVDTQLPFPRSVRAAGSEPNSVLSEGAG